VVPRSQRDYQNEIRIEMRDNTQQNQLENLQFKKK
jgi:hypothetical protein